MITAQSREPSAEQIAKWEDQAEDSDLNFVHIVYQAGKTAGREAALAELRAGGVELPLAMEFVSCGKDLLCYLSDAQDYGDRRAAVAVEKERETCMEVVREVFRKDDNNFTYADMEMLQDAIRNHQ
jgi:hypothetical protein